MTVLVLTYLSKEAESSQGILFNGCLMVIPLACTINIYDCRFYDRNDIGLYYNTLEMIVIDDPCLS